MGGDSLSVLEQPRLYRALPSFLVPQIRTPTVVVLLAAQHATDA